MKLQLTLMKLLTHRQVEPKEQKSYACWTCQKQFTDANDYLWHIQYCK